MWLQALANLFGFAPEHLTKLRVKSSPSCCSPSVLDYYSCILNTSWNLQSNPLGGQQLVEKAAAYSATDFDSSSSQHREIKV